MQDLTTLVLGIDVGGTKTHVRARAGDRVVIDLVRSSDGWRPHAPAEAAAWIHAVILDALDTLDAGPADPDGAERAVPTHAADLPAPGRGPTDGGDAAGAQDAAGEPSGATSHSPRTVGLPDPVGRPPVGRPSGTRPSGTRSVGAAVIGAVAVGAHGSESPRQSAEIRRELSILLGDIPCHVVNDSHLLLPAAGLPTGVGLVAGTGSVAFGQRPDGTPVQVGGWGAALGDEGGAAGLVREAARAVYAAHDRGEPPDALAERLLASLGIPEVPALGGALEAAQNISADWGRHAGAVFAAAADGSALARDVIEAGARSLAGLVVRLAERGVTVDDVVVAGGVALNQPVLLGALTATLAEALPTTRVHTLRFPPVAGAVELAQTLVTDAQALFADPDRRRPTP